MKNQSQIYSLLLIIFFSVVGTAMPYAILAPLFINDGQIFSLSIHTKTFLNIGLGLTLAAYPFGQFLGAPIIGRLSDRYGRKPILIYTLLLASVGYFFSAIALHFGNLYLLIITRFFTGILEANFAVAQAFIIDITENKQKDLGKLSSIVSMGYVLGPIIGAIFCNPNIVIWFNYSTPFIFAGLVSLILVALIQFQLKEKRVNKINEEFKLLSELNSFKHLTKLAQNFSVKWLLMSSGFLALSIMTYYEFYPIILASNWSMTPTDIAIVTAVYSVSLSIGALYISSILNKKKRTETNLCLILLIMIFGYILLISNSIYLVYIQFIILGIAYGTANNLQLVMLSNSVSQNQQGEVLGFRTSFSMLGNAIICILGGFIIIFSVNSIIMFSCCFALLSIISILILKRKLN